MTRTALVTGASGLLGRDVVKAFERKGWNVVGTGWTRVKPPSIIKLDLLNPEDIEQILDDVKPDVVIHCAANRFPDSCTADPASATAINVNSTERLASIAFERDILIIYISTDYVFSGRPGEAPYTVDATPSPPNVYGQTKYEGELAVLNKTGGSQSGQDIRQPEATDGKTRVLGVVLRVPVLYGHCAEDDTSKSAIHAVVDAVYDSQKVTTTASGAPQKIKVDSYAQRYPTATEDVGRVIVDISSLYLSPESASRPLPRILHFSAEQRYTKYEMAKLFAEDVLGFPTDNLEALDPTAAEPAAPAAAAKTERPYDSKLDVSVLRGLDIDVSTLNFVAWWRRELRAFRH
ncbi:NAD(P)-binding protein [Trichodelitschia bisporula]|uniref:NAD(P)-binding protein n=1 Tax=Trichodelitschia bisporula TaxID=703511 RepID=A0A6G1I4M5_9PEZI|nr:NAD(P)-binding protein [Trichodelitschia bisporula]